jgi:hypothetical protein
VEHEKGSIARHRIINHLSAATNEHETIKELLEAVFSVLLALCLRKEDEKEKWISWRSESTLVVVSSM